MTHALINEWRHLREVAERASDAESDALQAAWDVPLPANLRPAVPGDIIPGAIIWYPSSPGCLWAEVESVMDPTDDFKGYLSSGCRYGLQGAFVELRDQSEGRPAKVEG